MEPIPPNITMQKITHPGDIAQITGFRELLSSLNTDAGVDLLRNIIVDYSVNSASRRLTMPRVWYLCQIFV